MTSQTYAAPAAPAATGIAFAQETNTDVACNPCGSVNASPRVLSPGQQVTISGDAPENVRTGEWITLRSAAFVSGMRSNGIPTIHARVLDNHSYQVTATLQMGLAANTYPVTALYEGQPLDTVAWIEVRPYSSVIVSRPVLRRGQRVAISGTAPRSARAGEWITISSFAFASRTTSDGVPSVRTQVRADGEYLVTATVRGNIPPRTYTILGTYQGQPFDAAARINVRSTPRMRDQ
jgi:hypothetical protein